MNRLSGRVLLLCLPLFILPACDGGEATGTDARSVSDGTIPDADPNDDLDVGPADDDAIVVINSRINSIIPNRGSIEGGTRIRIVGRDFVDGTRVDLGGRACEEILVESENHIRCTTPSGGNIGGVDLVLRIPNLPLPAVLEDAFTYFQPIRLDRVEPQTASARGGAEVIFQGQGFEDPTTVRFGDDASLRVEIISAERLVAIVPPGHPGTVDVSVRNVNGEARLVDGFSRVEQLIIDDLTPRWGWTTGGDDVTLIGAGLLEESDVRLGEAQATVIGIELDRRRLNLQTPPNSAGRVDLAVSNANGESFIAGAFLYVQVEPGPFGVLGVAPERVSASGGTPFVVGGNGFTEATIVHLDGVLAACELAVPQLLNCIAAAHAPGSVDVQVTDGANEALLPGGLAYVQQVEIFDVQPGRGAIAGGTLVEILGTGFSPEQVFRFDDTELDIVRVESDRVLARTPANSAGRVALQVIGAEDNAFLPDAFEYFNPGTRFGGVWGERIERSINVTVLNAANGDPVDGAEVLIESLNNGRIWGAIADERGQVTISDEELEMPVAVTATKFEFEVGTFERVTNQNITIYISPHVRPPPGMGEREPIPPSRIAGTVTGLDLLEKPLEQGMVLAAFVETTHTSIYNRPSLPWPEPNGILTEDGNFDVFCRPGQFAIVVTAGYVPSLALQDYRDGQGSYWAMRQMVVPIAMGFQRYLSISPGESVEDLELVLDRPTDLNVPVTLDNPSGGVPGAPDLFQAEPILDFGADGYWALDAMGEGDSPILRVLHMPDIRDWPEDDIELFWIGTARSSDRGWMPYARAFETDRDLADGVQIGPFVGTPEILNPTEGSELGQQRLVAWRIQPGIEGPTEPAHVNLVQIQASDGRPIWTHVTPGAVDHFQLPQLPDELGLGAAGDGLYLTIIPMILGDNFNYEEFNYRDLGAGSRRSFSVNSTSFFP